jgi:hypothetical protein
MASDRQARFSWTLEPFFGLVLPLIGGAILKVGVQMPDKQQKHKHVTKEAPREVRGVLSTDGSIKRKSEVAVGGKPATARPTNARPQGVQASALQGGNAQGGVSAGGSNDSSPPKAKE